MRREPRLGASLFFHVHIRVMNVDSHMLSYLLTSLESLSCPTQLDSSFTLYNRQKKDKDPSCVNAACEFALLANWL